MRVLARRVERVFAGRAVELADRGARLHRVGDEPVVGEVELDDPRRLGKRRVDRGEIAEMPVVAEVAGASGHTWGCPASAPRPGRSPPAPRHNRPGSARRLPAPGRGSPRSRRQPGRRRDAPGPRPAAGASARSSASRLSNGSASRRAARRPRPPPCPCRCRPQRHRTPRPPPRCRFAAIRALACGLRRIKA